MDEHENNKVISFPQPDPEMTALDDVLVQARAASLLLIDIVEQLAAARAYYAEHRGSTEKHVP